MKFSISMIFGGNADFYTSVKVILLDAFFGGFVTQNFKFEKLGLHIL